MPVASGNPARRMAILRVQAGIMFLVKSELAFARFGIQGPPMNFRRKFTIALVVIAVAILGAGWMTLSRHIDMVFREDGIPLSGCRLELISGGRSEPQVFSLGTMGEVRLPSSLVGRKCIYGIFRDKELLHSVFGESVDRGVTTVDFKPSGIESIHEERFLFLRQTTRTESINPVTCQREQTGAGQADACPVPEK